jgi:hypothetical protein
MLTERDINWTLSRAADLGCHVTRLYVNKDEFYALMGIKDDGGWLPECTWYCGHKIQVFFHAGLREGQVVAVSE